MKKIISMLAVMVIVLGLCFSTMACSLETKYDVTFDLNGGTIGEETKIVIEVKQDKTVTAPEEAESSFEGYELIGWTIIKNDANRMFDFEEKITRNRTLFALWKEAEIVDNTCEICGEDPCVCIEYDFEIVLGDDLDVLLLTLVDNDITYNLDIEAIEVYDIEDNLVEDLEGIVSGFYKMKFVYVNPEDAEDIIVKVSEPVEEIEVCEECGEEPCVCEEPIICPECDHSDCSYIEGVEGVPCDFVCDHSTCAKQEAIEAVAGVACDFDAIAYEADIASYFTFSTSGWLNARVDAFDADLNRLWFYLNFESGVSVEAITITLTDEAGNEVVAVAKYNALAAANAGYAEIVFRDKDGGVYPFAHNGYWDTILTDLEEGVNEVANIKIELTTDSDVIIVNFDGECNLIIPVCDHSNCSYIEEVIGQEAAECDAVCDHSDCSYIEEVEGVECDYVCDHSECGYIEPEDDVDPTEEEESED